MSDESTLFTVNIVTPMGLIASETTDAVIAPGELGEFEIMPGHVPFLSALHPGVIKLGESQERKLLAVSRGYLQVDGTGNVEILVEQAITSGEVDSSGASEALTSAEKELKEWEGPLDGVWQTIKDKRDWAQAQLDAQTPN